MASVSVAWCCLWIALQPGFFRAPPASAAAQKSAPKKLGAGDEELLQNIDFLHFLELKENAEWLIP